MKLLFLTLIFLQTLITYAQPHVRGTIWLNVREGMVKCDLQLTGTPKDGSYALLLNKGFNVKYFILNDRVLPYSYHGQDENSLYELYRQNDTVPLHEIDSIRVIYTGAFPVYTAREITSSDDMGRIAIRNGILRATVQSNFVPALVERTTQQQVTSFTYDLKIISSEPETIFINGAAPQKGRSLHFSTEAPLDFFIYAGRYNAVQRKNITILNSRLTAPYIDVLAEVTDTIRQYYQRTMGLPYDGKVVFAQIFSIGPPDQYEEWAFTVTPSIVMDVDGLKEKIDLHSRKITDINIFRTLAHEMAHKYFMQQLNAMGTKNLWRFYHESLAQYLAYKAVEDLVSKDAYDNLLRKYTFTEAYSNRKFEPFDKIENTTKDLTNASYYYYPLYLIGFEKMFGKQKAFALLRVLVEDRLSFRGNTEYFISAIKKVGITSAQLNVYRQKFLDSENCLKELGNDF